MFRKNTKKTTFRHKIENENKKTLTYPTFFRVKTKRTGNREQVCHGATEKVCRMIGKERIKSKVYYSTRECIKYRFEKENEKRFYKGA